MSPPLPELKKAPWWVPLAIIALVLWCVNYGFVQIGWRPFLYCWGLSVSVVFEGWFQALKLGMMVYFAYLVYARKVWGGIWFGAVFVLVFGLPVFWETATALGTGETCR